MLLFLTIKSSYNANIKAGSENVLGTSNITLDSRIDRFSNPYLSVDYNIEKDLFIKSDDYKSPVMVVFIDYECPFCKRFYLEIFNELKTKYIDTNKLSLVFVNFPQKFHPQSKIASRSVECVLSEKGSEVALKYIDGLFASDLSNISAYDYLGMATKVGVENLSFSNCLNTNEQKINNDVNNALRVGVNTTPTVIIGNLYGNNLVKGKILSGLYPYEEYEDLIDFYTK